jgi:hypothetical protein
MNTRSSSQPHSKIATIVLHRWPVLAALALAAITPHKLLPLTLVLVICAISYPLFGTFMHQWRTGKLLAFHIAVFAVFAVVAYIALNIDMTISKYLLALAFVAHAIWDIYHFRVKQIVPRWYAEACGAFDVIVAILIILLPLK